MTDSRSLTLRWPMIVLLAALLLAIGAVTALWWRPMRSGTSPAVTVPPNQPTATAAGSDIEIQLSPTVAANAHLETAPVVRRMSGGDLQVPGTIEANAYNQTSVNALAAGRVVRVPAQLGDRVQRGAVLAEIYSPELAEAETAFLSMQADLESVHQELLRTERLATIGSASKQELEKARAEHARHTAGTESARTKLKLLGLTDSAIATLEQSSKIEAKISVTAPRTGEVTARHINEGATVASGAELFTVTDLSAVWVLANVYENDVARIKIGSAATVTTPSSPAISIGGRVSYIDPQVSAATRTAQVRIDVPNPDGRLRLAMYVAVALSAGVDVSALTVPATAIQQIGSQHVVYVAGRDVNQFVERSVSLGPELAGQVAVSGELTETDRVVTAGSFLLRSERERLGLRPPSQVAPQPAPLKTQRHEIAVTAEGFSPARITVEPGAAVELVFLRTTDGTCAKKVVFPGLKITKDLPLNKPVTVSWTPEKSGTVDFVCGMNMFKGAVVVK
jgi:RND family efflux transporter MFP subunit